MGLIFHRTGRTYNGAQILAIDAPVTPDDSWDEVTVFFSDPSRNIDGVVRLFGLELGQYTIGRAVLREYDAGRYDIH